MQVRVGSSASPGKDIAGAQYPHIRHFWVGRNATQKQAANCKGQWEVCSPDTVKGFSATAYFTGRQLHKNLDVPIGLLTSCWGGTCVEAWTPWAEQAGDTFAMERKAGLDEKAKGYSPEKVQARYEEQLKRWKKKTAQAKAQKKRAPRRPKLQTDPSLNQNYPGNLYNGMIHPLLPFAVKGALWYQGEANAKSLTSAEHYRVQLDCMVRSWRRQWGQDFPFYAVQLPNFKEPQVNPVESENIWPVIRESFVHVAQNTPDVYTSSMIDLGEAKNIHPGNKQDVGRRMASTILNKTYGKDTPTTPFMKSFAVEGNRVIIKFDYTGSGLAAQRGVLKGFAIAGSDKKFVWADAVIERRGREDCVAVSSKTVANPVAVRYAWADNPNGCSLYSKEGFPASPFRTDSWELSEGAISTSPKSGQKQERTDVKPVTAPTKPILLRRGVEIDLVLKGMITSRKHPTRNMRIYDLRSFQGQKHGLPRRAQQIAAGINLKDFDDKAVKVTVRAKPEATGDLRSTAILRVLSVEKLDDAEARKLARQAEADKIRAFNPSPNALPFAGTWGVRMPLPSAKWPEKLE